MTTRDHENAMTPNVSDERLSSNKDGLPEKETETGLRKKRNQNMKKIPLDFDIDHYLNRFVPRNRLYLLPKPISWFLGYRDQPRKPVGAVLVCFWAFFGAFSGLLVVEAVYMTEALKKDGSPIVIASLVFVLLLSLPNTW